MEFGTPWELIQKDGMFRELCRQSGEDAQLMEVSHHNTFNSVGTDEQMAKLAEERKKREKSNPS